MNSIASMKKNRQAQLDSLTKSLDQANGKAPQVRDDESDGLWKPTRGKDGNGYAVVRFLPAPKGEDQPFVRVWDHFFQGPGGWYIEKSRTTLGEQDPASELNVQLYATGRAEDKAAVSRQKRKLKFYSNVYIVKDPANPENEGKVFLYQYGKRIFDKLNDLMNPQYEDESPVNPFDFWEGADFKIKIVTQEMTFNGQKRKMPNYDKSEFAAPAPLLDNDDELEAIWDQCASLNELVDPSKFKSYDELKARLEKVLGAAPAPVAPPVSAPAPAPVADDDVPFDVEPAPKASADDDDDDLSFFKSLADE